MGMGYEPDRVDEQRPLNHADQRNAKKSIVARANRRNASRSAVGPTEVGEDTLRWSRSERGYEPQGPLCETAAVAGEDTHGGGEDTL